MITLARVDERLIHGQVAYAWTMVYPSDAIIVVDQEAEKDALQRSLLEMACPRTMKCFIANESKSVEILKKYPKKKFFLVAKHPQSFLTIMKQGIEMKNINIGGIYFKEGRKQITNTVFLDQKSMDILKELHERGVHLDGRTTPSDNELDLFTKL